jgi:hypothetical protein
MNFKVGQTYVFFTPPSWLIGGTITSVEGDLITIKDCVYLEAVNSGKTLIGDIALATSAKEMVAISARHWRLPDGTVLHKDGVLIATPCARDLKPLARSADADEIRSTK